MLILEQIIHDLYISNINLSYFSIKSIEINFINKHC